MPHLTPEQVRTCEAHHRAALIANDIAALERMHAEDRIHVHGDGRRENKETYLAPLRDGSVRYTALEPFGEELVRVDGPTGVLTGDLAWTAETKDGQVVSGMIAYTSYWVDRGAGAVQVHWHSSPTPRTPA
jgi:ketosteroid isomerase-like protein